MLNITEVLADAPVEVQAHAIYEGEAQLAILRVWPRPFSGNFTQEKGWTRSWPMLDDPFEPGPTDGSYPEAGDLGWSVALGPIFDLVPLHLQAALEPFDRGVRWPVLRLLAEIPETLDLVRSNPSLAALVALKLDLAGDWEAACAHVRELLHRPRRSLMPLVGLPATRSAVRVLSRLDPRGVAPPWDEWIRWMLNHADAGAAKTLRHLRIVTIEILIVLTDPALRRLSTFALLADEGQGTLEIGLSRTLGRVRDSRAAGRGSTNPSSFRSCRELERFCEDLAAPAPRAV